MLHNPQFTTTYLMKVNQTVKGVAAAFYSQVLRSSQQQTPSEFQIFNQQYSQQRFSFSYLYNSIYKLFRKAQIEPECLIAAVEYLDEFQRISKCYLNS